MLENLLKIPLKNVLGNMFGSGVAAAASLCLTGLLSWWEDDFDTDNEVTDLANSGSHEAINSISVYLDGGSRGTLANPTSMVGNFNASGSFIHTALSGNHIILGKDATSGILYVTSSGLPIFRIDATTHNYSDFTLVVDTKYVWSLVRVGPNVTLTINGVSQVIAVGTTTFVVTDIGSSASGTSNFIGYQWDVVLENASSIVVFQNALASGASSTVSASTVPAAGANDVTWTGLTVPSDWKTDDPRWGHSYNREDFVIASGAGTYSVGSYLPASYTSEGTLYEGTALQNLDVDGWMADLDGSEELTLAHLAGTESVSTKVGTSTVAVAAGKLTFTAGTVGYVLLDDGTELIFQSSYDSDQIIVYNVDGTARHGTFTGATVGVGGQWEAVKDASWLAQWGAKVSGINTIPGTTAGLAADGGALTFTNYLDAPANTVTITVPETSEMFGAIPSLFTGGTPDATDPTDLLTTFGDEGRFTSVAMIVTDGAQTGTCRDDSNDYLYPGGYLEMIDALEMLDTLEML